ncbi:MAG: winged helix-turn-helix transcriptional regulator [Nanoarchaeota archaeon]|nr:winged helix-turn-helix transcriptional regulator [DPANN group archaeon]MBL7116929.1 winged helix-turn-helix transcriptional regulator [Nanoarchaeota archaeon]
MKQINKKILRFFSSLADETRLKMLVSLTKEPKTVNEIYEAVGKDKLTLSAISHQLRQLSDLDIVIYEKKGREKRFQLSDSFCWCILRDAFDHFNGKTKCKECCKIKNKRRY